MAGDPTQTQPQTWRSESSAFQEWYVVTGGGASALRMTPGLTVGEWDSGALALNDPDPRNQWVEFVLADDGEPWATIVTRDRSLSVEGTTCLRHPLGEGAAVRLPNNTLHISRDIRLPERSGTVVEVVHRDIPERVQDLVGPGLEEALAEALGAVREPRPGAPAAAVPEPPYPTEPAPRNGEAHPESDRDAGDDWYDHRPTITEPRRRTRRPESTATRRPVAAMVGVLALGAATLAGVVAVLVPMGGGETARLENFDPGPLDIPPVVSPPVRMPATAESSAGASPPIADPVPPPAEVADGGSGAQAPPVAPSPRGPSDTAAPADAAQDRGLAAAPGPASSGGAETADSWPPPAAEGIPPSERVAATDQEPEQVANLSGAEAEPPARIVPPPVERGSIPPAAQTDARTAGAAEAVAGPEPIDSQPDASFVANLEEIGLVAQAVATDLTRRRDLLAADLALAQGRLMTPPETSAYTLYNRVLAVDPGSPEASSGLQSVRQALINRALAQLARNDLDDARLTLQSAAVAGADSLLIADLRDEVDYRQRLTGGQSQRSQRSTDSSR